MSKGEHQPGKAPARMASDLACPRCGSRRVRCYCSRRPVRYYGCRDCARRFKAIVTIVYVVTP